MKNVSVMCMHQLVIDDHRIKIFIRNFRTRIIILLIFFLVFGYEHVQTATLLFPIAREF